MPDNKPTDDEFAEREKNFNDNLGQVFGRFCTAIVEADGAAKDSHAKRICELAKQPNAEFVSESTLIGVKEPLQTRVSVPMLAITQVNPIEIKEANLIMDMTVSASHSEKSSLSSKAETKVNAKVGWGPFSVGVNISADVSVSKDKSRTSDYRATTHADVKMAQGETPEGLMLIIDSLNKNTTSALEINRAIVEAKKPELLNAAAQAGDAALPAAGGEQPAPATQ